LVTTYARLVNYDVQGESLALIEGRLRPAPEARLSRRRRRLPLCADVDEDSAVTVFARRGVSGTPEIDVHLLCRTRGEWRWLGGGGGSGDLVYSVPDGWMKLHRGYSPAGAGAAAPDGRWLGAAYLVTDGSVSYLRVKGRELSVEANGSACVVWRGHTPPTIALLSEAKDVLETLDLGSRSNAPGWPKGMPLPPGA
jgi:hypothetical protein